MLCYLFSVSHVHLITHSHLQGTRHVLMDENFFTGYRRNVIQPNEVLKSITIPYTQQVTQSVFARGLNRVCDDSCNHSNYNDFTHEGRDFAQAVNSYCDPSSCVCQSNTESVGGASTYEYAQSIDGSLVDLTREKNSHRLWLATVIPAAVRSFKHRECECKRIWLHNQLMEAWTSHMRETNCTGRD